jgi:phage terminase large subunit-like protein
MPFDESRALRVKTFCESLVFSKGKWAGKPFKLLDWQWERVVRPLFGTLREDGKRQYRFCYLEIPKKNGKTELGAALALYMLTSDGEGSPEVFSAAADAGQASLVYGPAAYMVRGNEVLNSKCLIRDSMKTIFYPPNNGAYKVLSAESYTKHGLSPSAIFFDELHSQPNDELWNVLTSGTDYARQQQIIFVMTTAGIYDKESIWWRIRSKAQQIAAGVVTQDDFLPVLYIADPEQDKAEDEELWARVNPSIGKIFTLDKIRADFEQSKQNPVDYQNFLRFRLNIPIKSLSRWMPVGVWDKCAAPVDLEALKGRRCFGGLDLSNKWDLTAFVLVFPPENDGERYILLPKFFCPEDTVKQRSRTDAVHYEVWQQQGHICATPGNVIDEAYIRKALIDADALYQIEEIGFDPWNATALAVDLFNNHGFVKSDGKSKLIEMRQGFKTLSEPTKALRAAAMKGEIAHGGQPVLSWNIDNMVVRQDANENVAPDKDKATERVDGAVASIMAWGRMIFTDTERSVYDSGGVYVIE